MNQQFGPLLYTIAIWALPAIIAITFHEAVHGFVAFRFGDPFAPRPDRRSARSFDDEGARPNNAEKPGGRYIHRVPFSTAGPARKGRGGQKSLKVFQRR
jgi:hypothetical protein